MFVENLNPVLTPVTREILTGAVKLAKSQYYPQCTLDHVMMAITQDRRMQPCLREEGVNISGLQASLQRRLSFGIRPPLPPYMAAPPFDREASLILDRIRERAEEGPMSGRELIEAIVAYAPYSPAVNDLRMYGFGNPDDAPKPREVQFSVVDHSDDEKPDWTKYVTDITKKAQKGQLQPVIGREAEITRMAQIAARVKKNNPLLIGEPGVGKTEMVNGFAGYLWEHREDRALVPEDLANVHIMALDMGALTAGAKHIGEFQDRLKAVLEGVKASKFPIMMFIDEVHTVIGAGAQQGGLDAANMLKPALQNGELRCIGATTYNEYQKYIMADPALERRFMIVRAEEPSFEQAAKIAYGLIGIYQKKHGADYGLTEENHVDVLTRVAKLSKMMPGRFLPDCLLDLIDEAGVRNRGQEITFDHYIDAIADMTGLPAHAINDDNVEFYLDLAGEMKQKVFYQDPAIDALAAAVLRHKMGLSDPEKPAGSFLFLGPTGVGKTAACKTLAEKLFGDSKKHFLRIDMSEFKDKHAVFRLFGAPPGYVGYEEGGVLTEFVRRNPYSVVLLDEIEKASPEVYEALYAVLDAARMTDGKGRTVDFKNTYIVMTTNATASGIKKSPIGFHADIEEKKPKAGRVQTDTHKELAGIFNNAFLGRVDEVMNFGNLETWQMKPIVASAIAQRNGWLHDRGKNYGMYTTPEADMYIAEHRPDPEEGARSIGKFVQRIIDTPVAFARAARALPKGGVAYIDVNADKTDLTFDFNRVTLADLPALMKAKPGPAATAPVLN